MFVRDTWWRISRGRDKRSQLTFIVWIRRRSKKSAACWWKQVTEFATCKNFGINKDNCCRYIRAIKWHEIAFCKLPHFQLSLASRHSHPIRLEPTKQDVAMWYICVFLPPFAISIRKFSDELNSQLTLPPWTHRTSNRNGAWKLDLPTIAV